MRNRARLWAALAAVLLALAAAACGGGDEEGADPSPTPGAATTGAGDGPSATASTTPGDGGTESGAADAAGEVYIVKSGDTLSRIAAEHDTTVEALVEANNLADPDVLAVDQELIIPARSASATSATPTP